MKVLQVCAYTAEKEVKNLQERREQCAEQKEVQIQQFLNDDFLAIMTENKSDRKAPPRRFFQASLSVSASPSG